MTGQKLIADINACRVAPGQCGLWWLGQHGFALKLGASVVYLDAYLSNHPERQVAPLLSPEDLTNADLVLGTHDHIDHIDRPAWQRIAVAAPQARFIVPQALRERIVAEVPLDPSRVFGLDEGRPLSMGDLTISAIPAAHMTLDADPVTGGHPYLGYIIEGHGFRLYHSGDCCPYDGLRERLQQWKFDLMILPINGGDNMPGPEAVELAGALAPGVVIPAHYEMFAGYAGDVAEFVALLGRRFPKQRVVVPRHGERVML
jgi:L-ascorbate metabolism protein UlaG (beta-lactamase superfamily)